MVYMKKCVEVLPVILGLGLALSAAGLAGCASNRDHLRSSAEYRVDKRLAHNVSTALNNDPIYKYPDVTVNVFRGRVQLSGYVVTEAQKQEATKVASGVPGVNQVENNLLLTNQGATVTSTNSATAAHS